MKITENTTLKEILEDKKKRKILEKFNLPCLLCPLAAYEMQNLKIGEIAKTYGINIKELMKELNQ